MVSFGCQFDWIKNHLQHLCGISGGVSGRMLPERIDWVREGNFWMWWHAIPRAAFQNGVKMEKGYSQLNAGLPPSLPFGPLILKAQSAASHPCGPVFSTLVGCYLKA